MPPLTETLYIVVSNLSDTMKFFTTLALLIICLFIYGQDSTIEKSKKIDLFGYVGGHNIFTPNLHSRLEKISYEKSAQGFLSFGLGFKYGQQQTIAGIDLSVYMHGRESKSKSNAFQLQAFLNHKIVDNSNLSVAPGVDVGLQSIRIDYKRIDPSSNFDTLFLSSGNYVKLKNLAPVAGISTIFHFRELDHTRRFLLRPFARIRIGYKYGLSSSKWKADNNNIINSPTDRLSSFYIQSLIGF